MPLGKIIYLVAVIVGDFVFVIADWGLWADVVAVGDVDDFEDMNYKRYLVTAVTLDVPYTMQGVFLNGVFYQDEDNTKEIKNVTHYAVMPKPATGE